MDLQEAVEAIHSPTIPTQNSFEILSLSSTAEVAVNNQKNIAAPPRVKVPNTFIYNQPTLVITKLVKEQCKNKFKLKINYDNVMVTASTTEDHKAITDGLKVISAEYFTYSPRNNKPVKLLIKGVANNIPVPDIEQALRELNLSLLSITFLKRMYNGQKYNLNTIHVNVPRSAASEFYKLDRLLEMTVKVEPYTTPTVPQCHRCRDFGYSSNCCARTLVCTRCSQNHPTSTCNVEERVCCDCGRSHFAAYKGCPAYKAILQLKKKNTTQSQAARQLRSDAKPPVPEANSRNFPSLPKSQKDDNNQKTLNVPVWMRGSHQEAPQTNTNTQNGLGDLMSEIKSLFQHFDLHKIILILKETS